MHKLFILLLFFVSVVAEGRKISEHEAAFIASEFLNSASPKQASAKAEMHRAKSQYAANADTPPFYVYNTDNDKGFVIISGDDCFPRILGYSNNGNFDFSNIPPQLAAILEHYSEQIKKVPNNTPMHESWKTPSLIPEDGRVILETANWGQGAPYNSQCPTFGEEHAPTGCVATAMAIVMKYHNWPEHTNGKEVTNFYHKDIIIDFNNSHINWENLKEDSDKFTNEVSKLMLLTGTSVHTHYELSGSGASMNQISHELITTFGYNSNCCYLTRKFYDDQKWRSLIDEQLNNGLPIIYGSTIEDTWQGHTYVLDGREGEMYHINWGWDGNCNGFFDLDFLKPANDNYSGHQSMIINIKPNLNPQSQYSPLHIVYGWNSTFRTGQINSTTSEIHRNELVSFTGPVLSFPNNFHGWINYALIDENDAIVEFATTYFYDNNSSTQTNENITPECFISSAEEGWRLDTGIGSFPIEAYTLSDFCRVFAFTKSDISPSHRVILVSKEDSDKEWKQVLGLNGTLNYVPTKGINSQWADVEWIYNSDLIGIKHFDPHIVGESFSRILRYQDYKSFNLIYKAGNSKVYINDILIDNLDYSDDYLGEFYETIENEYPRLMFPSNLPKYKIKIDFTPDPEVGIIATNISLNQDNVTLAIGESVALSAVFSPKGTSNKNLIWTSSDEATAVVDKSGYVTAQSKGECIITAKTSDGSNLSASCNVTVRAPEILVSSISLSPSSVEDKEGEQIQITPTVLPEDATNKVIHWSSSDENIASVDDSGLISLHKKGTAIITASATDESGISAECAVVVTELSGIEDVLSDNSAYVKIFDLKGVLVYEGIYAEANLAPDYYIVVCDGKSAKVKVK